MSSAPKPTLPNRNQDASESSSRSRRNIFEDPAIVEAGKNDPFIRFISANWRFLLAVLIAVGLGIVAYSQVTATTLQKQADATRALREMQQAYQEIVEERDVLVTAQADERAAKDDKARAEAAERIKKATETLKMKEDRLLAKATELEAATSFLPFSGLYRGLVAAGRSDFGAVQSALAAQGWETVGKQSSPERAAAELAVLGLAKALSDSDQHLDAAKQALKGLAERGDFAAVRAADAFAALATTPEEKAQAKALIGLLQSRMPAQQKLLVGASERLS